MKKLLPVLAVLALLAGLALANCAPENLAPDATATPTAAPTATPTAAPTATPIPVSDVTLSDSTLNLVVGGTATLTSTITPSDAANQNISYSSDATGVASVDPSGVVTAVSTGTAIITVTTEDGSITDFCVVTVVAASIPATGISIDVSATINVGATVQLAKTLTPSDTTDSGNVTWSSDAQSVATVDSAGLVTGIGGGTATITATVNNISDTCTITVNALPASAPTASVASGTTVTSGSTITLTSPESLNIRYVYGDDTVSAPTASSSLYSTSITVDRNVCIKAYAVGNGTTLADSPVSTFTYYVNDTANLGFEAGTPSARTASTLSSSGFFFTLDGASVSTASTVAANTDTAMHYAGTSSLKISATLVTALTNWSASDKGMAASYLGFACNTGSGTGLMDSIPGTTTSDATSTYDAALTGITTSKHRVNNAGTTVSYKLAVFIPAGSIIDRFGIILYDDAGGGIRIPLQNVTAGKWNYLVWNVQGKALVGDANLAAPTGSPSPSTRAMMCTSATVTVDGVTTAGIAGAASGKSPSDPSRIRFVSFIAGSTNASSVGTAVSYYLDSFTWQ